MEVTYTQTSAELRRRFVPLMPLRQRLSLLLFLVIPLLYCAVAYLSRSQVVIVDIVAGFYALGGILMAMIWAVSTYRTRISKPVTYTAKISKLDFSQQAAGKPAQRYHWADLGEIADLGDYFMFKSAHRQYVALIPRAAFDDEDQAQFFLMLSRQYWEDAKQRQQDETQKAAGSWPPAPRL